MASMPDIEKWGLLDPRPARDISVREVWDDANVPVETDPSQGLSWRYAPVQQLHGSRRPLWSNSPAILLPGSSSVIRKPTDYQRVVYSTVNNQNLLIRGKLDGVPRGNLLDMPLQTADIGIIIVNNTLFRNRAFWVGHDFPDFDGDPDVNNAQARATTECLVKLGQGKVDAGTALAELVKTTTHLAETASDIWRSVSALKGRRWGQLFEILSKRSHNFKPGKISPGVTAAKYWLEYNYAWKPLFLEAYGLVELVKLQLEPALLVHANRSVSLRKRLNVRASYGDRWSYPIYTLRGRSRIQTTTRLTGRIDSTAIRFAVAAGLINPASVLWELVPYSFVIDWTLPIGNYLEACTATRGLTFAWGSQTTRCQSHTLVTSEGNPPYASTLREGGGELMKFAMVRTALRDFPAPLLYQKSPFSSSHIGSALALLRNLV